MTLIEGFSAFCHHHFISPLSNTYALPFHTDAFIKFFTLLKLERLCRKTFYILQLKIEKHVAFVKQISISTTYTYSKYMHTLFCMYLTILCWINSTLNFLFIHYVILLCWMESILNFLFILSTLTLHFHCVFSSLSPPLLCPHHSYQSLLSDLAVSVS